LIDLHTHTSASDGRYSPAELVARAVAAGVTVLAVTDHDTVAGLQAAADACAAAGIELVPGIEITAVLDNADVHVLGYFFDVTSPTLLAFLAEQRRQRIDRVRQMLDRLAALGIVLDADEVLRPAVEDPKKSAGRPWIAEMLVSAGHVATVNEAFDRWLERGKPAFVARLGASPAAVIAHLHDAGGIASLAHPGPTALDHLIGPLAAAGLDAIEAGHSDHDAATEARYRALAAELGLLVTGGSDFHGAAGHRISRLGAVTLPATDFEKVSAAADRRRAH